jgi:toxin ParE1/3/4
MLERIEKTALATRDVEGLVDYYLAEAGISVARHFIDNAEVAFAHLARMPLMGAHLGFHHPPFADIRRWHIQGFPRLLILYRALPDGIELVRVLDASRDLHALFDDPGFSSS